MNEEEVKEQIAFLDKCARRNWNSVSFELFDEIMEELYFVLSALRKQLSEIIVDLPLPFLTQFARALQTFSNSKGQLYGDVQEEVEMFFIHENIAEKIEQQRKLSWNELLNK